MQSDCHFGEMWAPNHRLIPDAIGSYIAGEAGLRAHRGMLSVWTGAAAEESCRSPGVQTFDVLDYRTRSAF
jgi:hypothetical protein